MAEEESMIERVAKAIALDESRTWSEMDGVEIAMYTSFAIAAITAMREPTAEMMQAAIPRPNELIAERAAEGDEGYADRMDAAVASERLSLAGRWRDLIDAALRQGDKNGPDN